MLQTAKEVEGCLETMYEIEVRRKICNLKCHESLQVRLSESNRKRSSKTQDIRWDTGDNEPGEFGCFLRVCNLISHTERGEPRLTVFVNRVLREIFKDEEEEVIKDGRNRTMRSSITCNPHQAL
jgi:hypothetical protein